MTRTSIFIVLGLFAVLAVGQLSISTPSYVNYYNPASSASYYDTGSYQVLTTETGYSVASEATGIINIIDNPNCVGTNQSQFFCINLLNSSSFTQINLTTGLEFELFMFNQSIYSLSSYFNNVQVNFYSDFSNVTVINPPTQTPVCTMDLAGSESFSSALYFDGSIMTTPGYCYGTSDCSYFQYLCNGSNNTYTVNLNNSDIGYYYTQIMFLQAGGMTQILGFPYTEDTPSIYQGFITFGANSTYTQSFGNFTQIGQINSTNILVLTPESQLQQYSYSATTGMFTQVGSSLSVPSVQSFSISPISNSTTQVAVVFSQAQGGSNFYINLNTMTITSWLYGSAAQTFTNGSTFAFTSTGWFVANGTNVTYIYDSTLGPNANPSTYVPYQYPQAYPNWAFALVEYSDATPELFALDLAGTAAASVTTIAGASIGSYDMFYAATVNGTEPTIATYNYGSDSVKLYTANAGLILTANIAPSYYNTLVFISNTSNLLNIYTTYTFYSYSTTNGSSLTVTNPDFPAQFGSFMKLTENSFIAWSLTTNGSSLFYTLNITVINAWTQAIESTYIVNNVSEFDVDSIVITPVTTSAGNLEALYITSPTGETVSQNWIVYADNSTYSGNISTYVLPGQGNTALFCNSNLNSEVFNCTRYSVTDSNGGNGGTPGSSGSGTIIIIIVIVLVLLGAGFFVRRNMILKKAGGSTSGITLAKV